MKQRYQNKKKGETQHTHTQNGMCGIQGLSIGKMYSLHIQTIFSTLDQTLPITVNFIF